MSERGVNESDVIDMMPHLVKEFTSNVVIKKIFDGYFDPFIFSHFGDLNRRQVLEKIAYFILDQKNDIEKDTSNFVAKDILDSVESNVRPLSVEKRAGFIGKMTKVIKESKEAWQNS